MSKQNKLLLNFNRGIISALGLARQDIERLSLSSSTQDNFMPRVLGSMMLRPGLQHTGSTLDNKKAFHIPFIYSRSDTAILEVTSEQTRVKVGEVAIRRPAVSSAITNGSFATDLTGWTDADQAGATSAWATGGYMSLMGNGYGFAIRRQTVSLATADVGVEHAIRIIVARGRVFFKVGTDTDKDDIVPETELEEGEYSFSFEPQVNFYVDISASTEYASLVSSCEIESEGEMLFDSPWSLADLKYIKYQQSADVVYVACNGYQQRKFLRYGPRSWALVKYQPEDGPFQPINTRKITLAPSGLNGDITLTASKSFFKPENVGSLFRIKSAGQTVAQDVTAEDQWSDPIRVTGVGAARAFSIVRAGTWTATVRIQRSLAEPGSWVNVSGVSYTGNGTSSYNDGLDNQIVYYRIGVDVGDFTSGTAELSLEYSSGVITGIARAVEYTSPTVMNAVVLKDFGATSATEDWYESRWSDRRGFPIAVATHEGRMAFLGNGRLELSVSDAYESFDDETEGDSAPISVNIPSGTFGSSSWLLSMRRLMVGTDDGEWYLRASTQEQALTPSNANLKMTSNYGSSYVQALHLDNTAVFIQAAGKRLLKAGYAIETDDYQTDDMSKIAPELFGSAVVRVAMQRLPDTRIHCILENGTAVVFLSDELEDVKSFVTVSTDGIIEDVFVLPGLEEDTVYYSVQRTIAGQPARYLEKWALESECVGGTLNKQADSFVLYDGALTDTITGLGHLEGRDVIVWGDGTDRSPLEYAANGTATQKVYRVSGGAITLDTFVEQAVTGLPYKARYKSVKIGLQSQLGAPLNQIKKINTLGVVMLNTHKRGLRYGPSFDELDDLPDIEDWTEVGSDIIHGEYDKEPFELDGHWDTDSRLCFEAMAPRPCNLLSCVLQVTMHEKHDRQ